MIGCLHCTKRGRKDGSHTGATPSGAQCPPEYVCVFVRLQYSSNNRSPVRSQVYLQEEPRTRSRPENAWKEDVCRPYVSALNNAALQALRSPPPLPPTHTLKLVADACVALLLLSTQLKADPKERQCAAMYEFGTVAPAQTVC